MIHVKLAAAGLAALALSSCTMVAGPVPGNPEFAAAQVSRAYDCGVRVERGRIIARLPADERRRFVSANASYAVKSYKAPRGCDSGEREQVRRELQALARR